MFKTITIALALITTPIHAGPNRVSITLGSQHVGSTYEFDNRNLGLFLSWGNTSIGVYHNSFSKTSVAVTQALPLIRKDDAEVNLFVGLSLYPGDGDKFVAHVGDVVLIGGVQARYENAFIQVMPGDGVNLDAVVTAGLTFELGKK
jgi:hypothetical protein